jgi:hypothetical protein
MRVLWGVVVGAIGCGATYVVATKLGAIAEMILGPLTGSILGIIVAAGGIAIAVTFAVGVAKPKKPRP